MDIIVSIYYKILWNKDLLYSPFTSTSDRTSHATTKSATTNIKATVEEILVSDLLYRHALRGYSTVVSIYGNINLKVDHHAGGKWFIHSALGLLISVFWPLYYTNDIAPRQAKNPERLVLTVLMHA